VDVIDVAVLVVVLAVAGDLLRVRPEIGPETDVRGVYPAVDDGDEHGALRLLAGEQLTFRSSLADANDAIGDVEELPVAWRLSQRRE
jgi:hypothetical protein